VTDHGGSLGRARALFPDAPEPWVDLSTGINPHSYPHGGISATAFSRLPEPSALDHLKRVAARAYGAPDASCLAAAPGTQILLPLVMSLVPPGRAAVLSPTYAEHARAAALAGHHVVETQDAARLADADIAVVVNPNNPDGRVMRRAELLAIAAALGRRGGLLVIDEAFMDVGPADESLAGDVGGAAVAVLRSFGKFYGLAGVRLGFALASAGIAGRLEARLGPWAVPGPALELGTRALADDAWRSAMRRQLHEESQRLDELIRRHGLNPCGGTDLYRFARSADAPRIFATLGSQGVLVRAFDAMPDALRFGLPGSEEAWTRLEAAFALVSRGS